MPNISMKLKVICEWHNDGESIRFRKFHFPNHSNNETEIISKFISHVLKTHGDSVLHKTALSDSQIEMALSIPLPNNSLWLQDRLQ